MNMIGLNGKAEYLPSLVLAFLLSKRLTTKRHSTTSKNCAYNDMDIRMGCYSVVSMCLEYHIVHKMQKRKPEGSSSSSLAASGGYTLFCTGGMPVFSACGRKHGHTTCILLSAPAAREGGFSHYFHIAWLSFKALQRRDEQSKLCGRESEFCVKA